MENKIPKIMEEMSTKFNLDCNEQRFSTTPNGVLHIGTGTINTSSIFGDLLLPNGITSSTSTGTFTNTSTPELIDVIVTEDTIEHVFKRIIYNPMVVFNKTQVFKKIYGRKDGSEKELFGEYTPAQPESYYF